MARGGTDSARVTADASRGHKGKGPTMARETKAQRATREEAREYLREDIASAPRDTAGRPILYFEVTSVSRSGMSRRIHVRYVTPDRGIRTVSYLVGAALGERHDPDSGVLVHGCGMDMRFHLADRIAHLLDIADSDGRVSGNAIAWRGL